MSDVITSVERVERKQTREHTHTEQLKTATSSINMGDENKNMTPETRIREAKPQREDDRRIAPNPKVQLKKGHIGGSEVAAWNSRERKEQIIYLNNLIAWATARAQRNPYRCCHRRH